MLEIRIPRLQDLYSNERVSFLLIEEDTIASHEERGRAAAEQRSRDSADPSGSATAEQSSGAGFSGALLSMLQESVVNSGRFPKGTQLTALPHIVQVEMARGIRLFT